MEHCTWDGERVRVRAITATDAPRFLEHFRDTEAARLGNEIPFLRSPEDAEAWTAKHSTYPTTDNIQRAIEHLETGALLGLINTHGCDPRSGNFEYGIALFREFWGQGYGRDAVLLVLRHFFMELRYHRCTATVYAFNEASLAFHRSLGFVEEGVLRENLFTNGAYHDEYLFGMLRREFEERYSA